VVLQADERPGDWSGLLDVERPPPLLDRQGEEGFPQRSHSWTPLSPGVPGPDRLDELAFSYAQKDLGVLDLIKLRSLVTAIVSMAPVTVGLEHPVVVPVVAAFAHLVRLDCLLGLKPFILGMLGPAVWLHELFLLTFQ
jgi:hypothetical protein